MFRMHTRIQNDHRFDNLLFVGKYDGPIRKNIRGWSDDLVHTLDGLPLNDFDPTVLCPSENFLMPSDDGTCTSRFAECFNPNGIKDFSDQEKQAYCIKIATMRIHTYLFSILTGGNVIFFISGEALKHANWNFGAIKNPSGFGHAPAHKSIEHPLMTIPWEKLSPLDNIIFKGDYPRNIKMKDFLFPDDSGIPMPDPFIYAGYDRALNSEIRLTPAYENRFSQVLAVMAEPLSGQGGMLIMPAPQDMDQTLEVIVNGLPSASTVEQQARKEGRKAEFIRLVTPLVKADKSNPRSMTKIIADAVVDIDEKQSDRTYLRYLEKEFPEWYAEKSAHWVKNKSK